MHKKRQRRLFRRLRDLARLVMALIVAYGIYWLWASPVWHWQGQLAITGNRLVSKQEILDRLEVPADTALYRLNPQWVASQLTGIPTIAKVAVRRWLFPPRLELTVLERQPLVSVTSSAGNWWMDQEGVVFAASPKLVKPRFAVKLQTGLKVGDRLPASVQAHLFEILTTWPAGASGHLDMRQIADVRAVVDGWPLRLGTVDDVPVKFGMFQHLKPLAQKYKDRLQYIDLRFPESPAFKLKSGDSIDAKKPAPKPSPASAQSPAPKKDPKAPAP